MYRFILLLVLTVSLANASNDTLNNWEHNISISINPGITSKINNGAFGLDTLDNFGGNWRALSVDAEYAYSWEKSPRSVVFEIDEKYKDYFQLYFQYGITKDLEAFADQDISNNIPVASNEFDINFPYEAWIKVHNEVFDVTLGRQSFTMGPSESRGVAFSGSPYHDALLTTISFPVATYSFAFIAVDPYLGKTINGSGNSEEEIQNMNNRVSNQHNVFSEPYKNIALHRFEFTVGMVQIGLMEQIIIGGKSPDLRDINPLIFWHHSYGDGFSNSIASFDIALITQKSGKFYTEVSLDEVQYSETESDGNPTVFAAMAGWKNSFSINSNTLDLLFEAIYTDPLYGNSKLPLLKHTNRKVYRSNYRDREDPGFADTYVVDYPIGYYRGPDKLDFWLDITYTQEKRHFGAQFAYLLSGENSVYSDNYDVSNSKWALSSNTTREIRSQVYIKSPLFEQISGNMAILYRYFPWEDQENDLEISLGFSRTFVLIN